MTETVSKTLLNLQRWQLRLKGTQYILVPGHLGCVFVGLFIAYFVYLFV